MKSQIRSPAILHVDMDAFFASVELLERPDLRGKAVIVGHKSARSVVTSATYEARAFGVRAAMPMAVALRHCPHAIVLEPSGRYRYFSHKVIHIFHEFTPLVEPVSIDEAFLDVSGAQRLWGTPHHIAAMIRQRVKEQTGLTCSIGGASTKFIAKLASENAKPDGMLIVPPSEVLAFLHPLPLRALSGIGGKTETLLTRGGLRTVGDIAATPPEMLIRIMGEKGGRRLYNLAQGIDNRRVVTWREEKSLSAEKTFEHDVHSVKTLHHELLYLATKLGTRLRRHNTRARTISIKVRFADFTTRTRSKKLPDATDVGKRIYNEARALFDAFYTQRHTIRLIGVRAENLESHSFSVALWDPDTQWRETERVVDQLQLKFGHHAVKPAALINRETTNHNS